MNKCPRCNGRNGIRVDHELWGDQLFCLYCGWREIGEPLRLIKLNNHRTDIEGKGKGFQRQGGLPKRLAKMGRI